MKRHIFFIGTLRNGGAERVVSILASKLAEQGTETEILMYYDRPVFYEVSSKVKLTVVEKETRSRAKIKNLLWMRKYFKENGKVVISFLAPFNIMALLANFGSGTPIIVADRNDPRKVPANTVIRKLRDFLYVLADGIVVQTEFNKSYFSKRIQKKSKVIYNPVHMKESVGLALKAEKAPVIVTAGRLMPQKNQKMLINAFSEISKKYDKYQLIIYGEGPSREALEKQIRELQLEGKVLLPGNVNDLYDRMKNAELFVLSSDYEGMPNALIEAMCLGLPVISTKVSGTEELVIKELNGILTAIGDEKELVEAMDQLLKDAERRAFYARENVKLAKKLNLDVIIKEWTDFIEEI